MAPIERARITQPALRGLAVVLRPAPVLTVAATAAFLAVSLRVAPFGLPLALILLSWYARHSIATLHALAGGAREVPVLSLEMIFGTVRGWRSFFVMLVLIGLLFATGAASFWLGTWLATVVAFIAVLLVPPALLALGWTDSISAALDPRTARQFAMALGRDFWTLVVVSALVMASTILLLASVQSHFIARIAVVLLGWLLLVAISGATIHANRETLGSITQFHRTREPAPRSADQIEQERQRQFDEIYAIWRSGDRNDAWYRIELLVKAASSGEELLRGVLSRTRQWDAPALADRIAEELITLDMQAGRSGSALKLARERLALDRTLSLRDSAMALELARLALQVGDGSTSVGLLAAMEHRELAPSLREGADQLMRELRSRREG
jgi:hypothetical protein